jgi:PIN domain nuclease of toxin-antitoxin system
MRVLLDTHYLLWALDRPARLPLNVRAVIEDTGNDIMFSAASIWEIGIKAALRSSEFEAHPHRIAEAAVIVGFTCLPITAADAASVADLPMHHRDPFARLLVAQALALPARLLTADTALLPYADLIWHQPPLPR